jgi:hypothetical protein
MSRSLVRCLVAGLLLAGVGGVLPGSQPRRVSAAPVSFTALNQAYTQNFDTLPSTGTPTWANDSTLAAWYSNQTTAFAVNNGSSNTGSLYSYGTGASSERALGSVASNTTGSIFYGVRFVNNTGAVIPDLRVSYTGEQWRNGGNATPQSLVFSYQIGTNLTSVTAGTWTGVAALNFTSPVATNPASTLDGNVATNQANPAANILSINLPAGQEIMLRWEDLNDSGNDHGLAVDDLEVVPFQLTPTAVSWAGSSLRADKALAWSGDTLTYRLSVSDPEGGAFRVSDSFDPRLTVLSAPGMLIDGRTVVAEGVLAPGVRQTYAIKVLVAADYAGVLNNSASIFGAGTEHSLEAPPVSVRQAVGRLLLPRIQR